MPSRPTSVRRPSAPRRVAAAALVALVALGACTSPTKDDQLEDRRGDDIEAPTIAPVEPGLVPEDAATQPLPGPSQVGEEGEPGGGEEEGVDG